MLVPIGLAAKLCSVSPTTVRRWTDRGCLPDRRTPTGRRMYETKELTALCARLIDDQRKKAKETHDRRR